ncbi:MAG: hypothetical protein HGA54_09460, partial [Actinobacteria bacterium]|nr:hypothetical protein [Actinomycetota bacterium]
AGALDDSTLAELVPGAAQIASGSTAYIGGIEQGIADAQTQAGTYGEQATLAQQAYATALQNAYTKILGGETVTADDLAAIDAAAQALVQVQSAAAAYDATATALTGTKEGYVPLDAGIQNLNYGIQQQSAGITGLADGLWTLNSRFSQFNTGIRAYTSGVSTLSSGFGSFSEGLSEFASGTTQLHESTATLDQDLIDGIKEELRNYLGGDFTPRSFVDPGNTAVDQVQFVIMTDPIEMPEEAEVAAPIEEDKTIWERFLDLFH